MLPATKNSSYNLSSPFILYLCHTLKIYKPKYYKTMAKELEFWVCRTLVGKYDPSLMRLFFYFFSYSFYPVFAESALFRALWFVFRNLSGFSSGLLLFRLFLFSVCCFRICSFLLTITSKHTKEKLYGFPETFL